MFCKQCGYRLWNLGSRNCPECGTPFKPSEFEFTPNSVEFRCPHCAIGYYGTGLRGHLVPDEFDCVRCHKHIRMDEMILLPTEGVAEEVTRPDQMPWLERRKIGLVKGWWNTVKMAMVRPHRLIEVTPADGSTGSAIWFAALTTLITYGIVLLPVIGLLIVIAASIGGGGAAATVGGMLAFPLIPTALMLIAMLFGGLVTHGLLRITGPTQHGLGRTYQALSLASGANLISALPCLGPAAGAIWWLVSAILMIREGQRVSGWRASFAVLSPPLVLTALFVTLIVWSAVQGFNAARTAAAAAPGYVGNWPGAPAASRPIFDALKAYAADHQGDLPPHTAELLIADGPLVADDLFDPWEMPEFQTHPLGDSNLNDIAELSVDEQQRAARIAQSALPADVIAHRVGNCVFTYHGINLNTARNDLWLLVRLREAPGNTDPNLRTYISVAVDGTATTIYGALLPTELSRQNQRRAAARLAPLPDPATVTPAAPARGTFDPAVHLPGNIDSPPADPNSVDSP